MNNPSILTYFEKKMDTKCINNINYYFILFLMFNNVWLAYSFKNYHYIQKSWKRYITIAYSDNESATKNEANITLFPHPINVSKYVYSLKAVKFTFPHFHRMTKHKNLINAFYFASEKIYVFKLCPHFP